MVDTGREREATSPVSVVWSLALVFVLPALLVCFGERVAQDAAQPGAQERLFAAADAGDVETVNRLLGSNNARINAADAAGCTALYHATRAGRLNVVNLLLSRGADVSIGSPTYGQPLIRAAQNEQVDVAAALLAAGADPRTRDACGNTPLHYAGTTCNMRMADLLRAAGADE